MKVLFPCPFWGLSGVVTYIINLAKGLNECGFESEIIITGPNISTEMKIPDDIKVNFFKFHGDRLAERSLEFLNYIENSKPDILMLNVDYMVDSLSPMLPPEIKTVGVLHCDSHEHYERFLRYGVYWDTIVTVSQFIKDTALKINPSIADKLFYVPTGITMPQENVRDYKNNPIRLVYSGRIEEEHKRFNDIISIARILKNQGTDFILEVIGSGNLSSGIERIWQDDIQAGRVILHGTITPDDVNPILAKSDLMLLTSDYEGFSMSLLEGMAMGCVPLANNIASGVPQVITDGDTGYIIEKGDLVKYARIIEDLSSDRNKLIQISRRARKIVEDVYTLENMVSGYRKVIVQTLEQPKSSVADFRNSLEATGNMELISNIQANPEELANKNAEALYLRRRMQGIVPTQNILLITDEINGHGIPDFLSSYAFQTGSTLASIPSIDLKILAGNIPDSEHPLKSDLKRKWFTEFLNRNLLDNFSQLWEIIIQKGFDQVIVVANKELTEKLLELKKEKEASLRIISLNPPVNSGHYPTGEKVWSPPLMDDEFCELVEKADICISQEKLFAKHDMLHYKAPSPYPTLLQMPFKTKAEEVNTSHLLFWGNIHNNRGLLLLADALEIINNEDKNKLPGRISFLGRMGDMPSGKISNRDFISSLERKFENVIMEEIPAYSYSEEFYYIKAFQGVVLYYNDTFFNFTAMKAKSVGLPVIVNNSQANNMIFDNRYRYNSNPEDLARVMSDINNISWPSYNSSFFSELNSFWSHIIAPMLNNPDSWKAEE